MPVHRKSLRVLRGGPFAPSHNPFTLTFRPPDHPRAVRLRNEYGLDKIAGAGADFIRARRLKTWLRRQWNHGYDELPAKADALDFIAAGKAGKQFACGKYAFTFVQCCLAIGLPARTVIIKRREAGFPYDCPGNSAHVTTEVYSRELSRWVILDVDLNAFYRRARKPIGALEIHKAWHHNQGRGITQVRDKPDFVVPTECGDRTPEQIAASFKDFGRKQNKPFYHHVYTKTAQGYTGVAARKIKAELLCYAGILPHPPALDFVANRGEQGLECTMVAHDHQFNWPIQQTFIRPVMVGNRPSRRVELHLQHNMPFFDHFELSNAGPFRRTRTTHPIVTLPVGRTTIKARAVDSFNLPGHVADITFEMRESS